ncbi:MAG: hypothetical protein M1827_006625 [Pycnora praestabilis]|nr:MAG: hypothetical protein M1827_006625 [Pycnora praestabilis]
MDLRLQTHHHQQHHQHLQRAKRPLTISPKISALPPLSPPASQPTTTIPSSSKDGQNLPDASLEAHAPDTSRPQSQTNTQKLSTAYRHHRRQCRRLRGRLGDAAAAAAAAAAAESDSVRAGEKVWLDGFVAQLVACRGEGEGGMDGGDAVCWR